MVIRVWLTGGWVQVSNISMFELFNVSSCSFVQFFIASVFQFKLFSGFLFPVFSVFKFVAGILFCCSVLSVSVVQVFTFPNSSVF